VGAGLWFGLALVGWLTGDATAQELPSAEVSVEPAAVALGDPVRLQLTLRHSPGSVGLVPPLDSLLASSATGPVDVASTAAGGGVVEQTYSVELRYYDLGVHLIPGVSVGFPTASGDTLWRQTHGLQIGVGGVRQPGDEALRSIRGPVTISGGVPLWLAGVVAAAALLGIAAVAWWLVRHRRGADAATSSAAVNYAAEFSRIATMGLIERGAYKAYYSLLSDTLRRFLEDRIGVDALDQTTQEIAAALRATPLVDALLADRILDFLRQADLAKFARAVPSPEAARRDAEGGQLLVGDVEADVASRLAVNASVPVASTASGEIAAR